MIYHAKNTDAGKLTKIQTYWIGYAIVAFCGTVLGLIIGGH